MSFIVLIMKWNDAVKNSVQPYREIGMNFSFKKIYEGDKVVP